MTFLNEYTNKLVDGLSLIDSAAYDEAYNLLKIAAVQKIKILAFGNGGSAAIAEHLSCDHMKGVRHDSHSYVKPEVQSLPSNMSLMTAIANDYGYEHVFSEQIRWCNEKAIVIAISSSGNSPNIVGALRTAREKQYQSIALVGFKGGAILREGLADHIIHVPVENYGVVEDAHQVIMHAWAQQMAEEFHR